jgi:uncharacterized membrane protein (DUF441 family)
MPPPPPPRSTAPPPPSFAAAPPPGVVYARPLGATPTDTRGLRTATIVLYWCAAASTGLLLISLIGRRRIWSQFVDGDRSLDDLRNADDFVGAAGGIATAVAFATVIVLSIWALRTARHARATGASTVSPGLACGGWYIPFANLIVPFVQLRRVAAHRNRSRSMVNMWQGLLIGVGVAWLVLRGVGNVDENTADDLSARLTTEVVIGVILVIGTFATAFFASRAMKDIDAA